MLCAVLHRYVAAAATAAAEHGATHAVNQDIGHCYAPRFYHRYLRPDALGVSIPSSPTYTYSGQTLLTDSASRAQPDFHIAFAQMLTNALPASFMTAQATASQSYWTQVLANVANGASAPYSFSWLSDAATVSTTVSRLSGMVGVSAGLHPNANFPTGTTDGYRANSINDASEASGGHNPDFLYHLPSAYSFAPELPGVQTTLLRMWDAGVGMKAMPPVNLVETGVAEAGGFGGTCTCPNGQVY
jgi:hypothetical protein